jgi:hypothetical protein
MVKLEAEPEGSILLIPKPAIGQYPKPVSPAPFSKTYHLRYALCYTPIPFLVSQIDNFQEVVSLLNFECILCLPHLATLPRRLRLLDFTILPLFGYVFKS